MRILAIDTASSALSAAVLEEEEIIAQFGFNIGCQHSQIFMPMLEAILDNAKLTLREMSAIAVTVGPGSFTGLRIGIASAKAWGQALGLPLIPIDTLDALACLSQARGLVCPIVEARRDEVYYALFRDGLRIGEDKAVTLPCLAEEIIALDEPVTFLGDALSVYREILSAALEDRYQEDKSVKGLFAATGAVMIARESFLSGKTVTATALSPIYILLPEAQKRKLEKEKIKSDKI